MPNVLIIASAAFSPNPVILGNSTKLSATVLEVDQTPYTSEVTSGMWTCGQA